MLLLNQVLGFSNAPEFSEKIHGLSHTNAIEYLALSPEEVSRKRLRLTTDRGTDCAIALDRTDTLGNGAILWLENDRAIVVRMNEQHWLPIIPRDTAAALEIGYFVGNLHWKVKFNASEIHVALDGPTEVYLDRLQPLIDSGKIEIGQKDA